MRIPSGKRWSGTLRQRQGAATPRAQGAHLASFGWVPAVEVDELVVRYGDLVAVAGISLRAEAGQVTAVLGPNGAGKTSTIEVLEGYRRPTGGTVRVLGLDPIRDHARLVTQIGVMLQSGGVYPGIRTGGGDAPVLRPLRRRAPARRTAGPRGAHCARRCDVEAALGR